MTRITMSNTLDTVYKALVALNNVGISLLRVGCHGEAKEAFSDALLIIHELLSVPAASPDEDLVSRTSITANIISKTQKLASIPNDENMQHIFNYTTIEPYECSDILRRCLADIFPIKAFLIRIESYTGSSRFPFGDYCPALESSIILYNCAIAHLHFHETRDMVQAYNQLALSCYTMSKLLRLDHSNEDNHEIISVALPLSVIVSMQLAQLSLTLNRTEEYAQYLVLNLSLANEFLQFDARTCHLPLTAARAA